MTVTKPSWWLVLLLVGLLLFVTAPFGIAPVQAGTPETAASPVATPAASPSAAPVAAAPTDRDVTFKSGPDTLYGSLMMPAKATGKVPAAVVISGSGPTDRNGNDPQFTRMNTNLNFARTLAGLGVASLRYDKVTSGKAGLATHTAGKNLDFDLFVDEARDAYRFLAAQPGIDPNRILLLGHSEGGLIALVVATHPTEGARPAGVILAAAPGERYLDLLRNRLDGQLDTAAQTGQLMAVEATASKEKLANVVAEIRAGGKVTTKVGIPAVDSLFNPLNMAFLYQTDKYDPEVLASSLPADYPVIVLRGEKDSQLSAAGTDRIMDGLRKAGNTKAKLYLIPNADHIFRIVPGTPDPVADYNNPALTFAPEVEGAIGHFLAEYGFRP